VAECKVRLMAGLRKKKRQGKGDRPASASGVKSEA